VHVGELTWDDNNGDTDISPTSDDATPDVSFRIEADFYSEAHPAIVRSNSWTNTIANNLALYGVDVEFVPEREGGYESLNDCDITGLGSQENGDCSFEIENYRPPSSDSSSEDYFRTSPFDGQDLRAIAGGPNAIPNVDEAENVDSEEDHKDVDSSVYMFVGDEYDDGGFGLTTGTVDGPLVSVVTAPFVGNVDQIPETVRQDLSEEEQMRAVSLPTAIHEFGHVLNIGENDDSFNSQPREVYTGELYDYTPEAIIDRSDDTNIRWSAMNSGTHESEFVPPTDHHYAVYSIEELFTVSDERVVGLPDPSD